MALTATVFRTRDEVRGFAEEWRRFLSDNPDVRSFYHTPDWLLLTLDRHPDRREACVTVVRDSGRPVCVASCFLHRTDFELLLSVIRLARVPARVLTVGGNEFAFAGDADAAACTGAVFDALSRAQVRFSYAAFHPFAGGAQHAALQQPWDEIGGCRAMDAGSEEKLHRVRSAPSADAYLASLSKRRRSDLRRRKEKLMTALGPGAAFTRVTEPDDVPSFLAAVERVYPRTWQVRAAGYFRRNGIHEIDAFRALARRGIFRGYLLSGADGPVAYGIGFEHRGIYWFDEQGFDPAYAELAPGTVLNYLVVQDLHDTGRPIELLDYGYGDHQFKRVFGNETHALRPTWVVSGPAWMLLLGFQRALTIAEGAIRRWLTRSGWDERVRRILRSKPAASGSAETGAPVEGMA